MQPDKFPYQHQSDTTSRHFGVDGIAATEMKFEQLLFVRWQEYQFPYPSLLHSTNHCFRKRKSVRYRFPVCILMRSKLYFQDRFHLFLIKPHIHIPEIAFICKVDMLDIGVRLECVEYLSHEGIQFVFRNIQLRRVYIRSFEIDQIRRQA